MKHLALLKIDIIPDKDTHEIFQLRKHQKHISLERSYLVKPILVSKRERFKMNIIEIIQIAKTFRISRYTV